MWTEQQKRQCWDRTDGHCHITGTRLDYWRYGDQWEIDHSRPRKCGGTDHPNNLFPALVSANRYKGTTQARAVRFKLGTRLPESRRSRERRERRILLIGGAVIGLVLLAQANQQDRPGLNSSPSWTQ